ncbi:MAG: hypothetical protein EOP83_04705 [Verrucomicrobiaceae bacterium]|nr:MAG: hypothetical protein EOP83_04705 [Verrucomicrobiaceae bacterium]
MSTNPTDNPDHYGYERCLKVTLAAEQMLRDLSSWPSEVGNGLGPRPRPGEKAKARVAFNDMLRTIHELRQTVDRTRPFKLVGGGE